MSSVNFNTKITNQHWLPRLQEKLIRSEIISARRLQVTSFEPPSSCIQAFWMRKWCMKFEPKASNIGVERAQVQVQLDYNRGFICLSNVAAASGARLLALCLLVAVACISNWISEMKYQPSQLCDSSFAQRTSCICSGLFSGLPAYLCLRLSVCSFVQLFVRSWALLSLVCWYKH